jgi:hypothetical protein
MRRAMAAMITVRVIAGVIVTIDNAGMKIGGRHEAPKFCPCVFVVDGDFEADTDIADDNHCQNELLHA